MTEPESKNLTLLGNAVAELPASPKEAILESFENKFKQRDYEISINAPDFTSLCPVTGQPDFAHISISYIPGDLCVETKSLKLYLGSFRNYPSFNEEVVNRILDDLVVAVNPRRMTVVGEFAARGGISLTITAEHPNPNVK